MKHQPNGLAHIGVPCSDLKKSLAFYQGLGFQVLVSKQALAGYDVAMVENGGCVIELYEFLGEGKNGAGTTRKDGCVDHIALSCADLDGAYAECLAAGYRVVSDGIESTALWSPRPCRYFTFLGPDGERIEFSQLGD